MMRRPILAANWKMQKTASEALAFAEKFLRAIAEGPPLDIVIAPPFTALDRLGRALGGSPVELAAQNVNAEPAGAHTGEISVSMLLEFGCRYGIVGHSERRAIYGEESEQVAAKAVALQAAGLHPIVCAGETLEERDRGDTLSVVGRQLDESLVGVAGEGLVIAYEPVWAIGTGRVATPDIAQQVHAFVRERLEALYGEVADSIRIKYGGSVKPDNAAELMAQSDIDGALVGGASLEPDSFAQLVSIVSRAYEA